MATVAQEISALYSAIFSRAPDKEGLDFWTAKIDGGASLADAAEGFTQHPVFTQIYQGLSDTDFVNALYVNILGSAGDTAGVQFWVDRLAGGDSKGQVVADFVTASLDTDLNALLASGSLTQAEYDAAVVRQETLTNKADVGVHFANTYGASSNLSATTDATTKEGLESDPNYLASQAILSNVTADPASVTAANALIDSNPIASLLGKSFTLTTGADTITGAAGSDIITGVSSALSSAATLNAGDKIDGGVGNDTLKVDLQSNFAGFSSTGGVSNVETVELTNSGTIARTFDAKGVAGVQDYVLNGEISLADLASTDAAITLNGQQKDVTLGFAPAAVSGSADALTLNLNNVGTAADAAAGTSEARVAVTASGIETLNLGVAGTNVVDVNDAQAKSVVAAGTGALDIGFNSAAAVKTVDASAVAGNVTVDLAGLSGATTVATGAGDDTITAGSGDLALNATLVGGAGNDTLALNGITGTVQYQMSGVETVSLAGSLAGPLIFSAAKSTGIQTVEAASDFSGSSTFAGLGSSDIAFDLQGASSGSITADQSGASTISVTASDATIKAADATALPDTNTVGLNLSNSSSVNLSVGEYASYSGSITAAKATSVEISGNVDATVNAAAATAAVLNTTGNSTLNLTAAKLTDLSANVAAVTAGVSGGLTLSGLAGVQSLTANVGANSTLTTGNLAAINSINLSGAGQADLGDLGVSGSGAKDYGINVTATGLENPVDASGNFVSGGEALTIGNINVGAGQTINLNVAGVAGNVLVSGASVAVDASGNSTGTITVNANGTQGDVTLGALAAKTVTVDASNAAGTVDLSSDATAASGSLSIKADAVTDGVKLGALSGGSVTVDAQNVTLASGSSVVDAVSGGTITATTGSINVNVDGAQGNVVFGTVSGAKDVTVDAANVAGTVDLSSGVTATSGSIDINVSGATKDVTLGALTSTAKNVSVDASNALGVVQVGTVSGSATSGSIDINVSGATKAVTLDTLTAKDVTVDASDVLGAVHVGDVTATSGSIDINLDGTTDAVSLGALSAKNVTVDATDALGGVAVGSITVGDTLVFNGSDLNANTVNIIANGASLNATLNGGIENDTFTISGGTTTLKYTVAGDLEIGANTVSVDAAAHVDVTKSVTIDTSALKNADVTITGGAGNDTIKLGAATEAVVVGAKASAGMDVISGFTVGTDTLDFGNVATFTTTAVDVSAAADLSAALNLATTGTATGVLSWFVLGGNTYVVEDNNAATTFTATTDVVVELTGVQDLSGLAAADFVVA